MFVRYAPGTTIEARLEQAGGITSGFDYLRIALAMAVICWHSQLIAFGLNVDALTPQGALRAFGCLILPMFFALSGFLVAGSLQRSNGICEFVLLRVLRIVPALVVEILLSALILGPLLTGLPLAKYFADPEFRGYLLNVYGIIHYHLPGVFLDNPLPEVVNGALWTIPYELECYLVLVFLAIAGLTGRRMAFLAIALTANIVLSILAPAAHGYFALPSGNMLVVCFLAGVSIHLWRDRIPVHPGMFLGSAVLALALMSRPETTIFAAFPAAYATVFLGLTAPSKNWFLMSGDYSYGLYLFAFPIQQAYAYLFPGALTWWADTAFAIAVGLCYAIFSWHVVEKQILRRKRHIIRRAQQALAHLPAFQRALFASAPSDGR